MIFVIFCCGICREAKRKQKQKNESDLGKLKVLNREHTNINSSLTALKPSGKYELNSCISSVCVRVCGFYGGGGVDAITG